MSTDNQQRPRAATMHERTVHDVADEQGGRWKGNKEVHIVGTRPAWAPPAIGGAGPWATTDIVPPEEPLGIDVNWLPDLTTVDGSPREWLQPPEPEPDYEPDQPEHHFNRRGL